MLYAFDRLRSPEIGEVMKERPLVILPVGQIEEHGPHLPVNCDCAIGEKVAEEVARRLGREMAVMLMPPVSYGYSGKTMTRWAGTMRVPMNVVQAYVYEICASLADMGVEKLAIVNSHGHHTALCELVARKLADEKGVAPAVLMPLSLAAEKVKSVLKGGPGSSCHAGEMETSLMLFLDPERVDLSAAKDHPVADVGVPAKGVFWSTWERQETPKGLYGAPRFASAETGKVIFEAVVEEAVTFLRKYRGEAEESIGFRS